MTESADADVTTESPKKNRSTTVRPPRPRKRREDRPDIPIPGSDPPDVLSPTYRIADEVGLNERDFLAIIRKAGVPVGRHGCVNYAPRAQAIGVIVAGVLGEKLPRPKRRGRGRG
jgi:hypothetical protein